MFGIFLKFLRTEVDTGSPMHRDGLEWQIF